MFTRLWSSQEGAESKLEMPEMEGSQQDDAQSALSEVTPFRSSTPPSVSLASARGFGERPATAGSQPRSDSQGLAQSASSDAAAAAPLLVAPHAAQQQQQLQEQQPPPQQPHNAPSTPQLQTVSRLSAASPAPSDALSSPPLYLRGLPAPPPSSSDSTPSVPQLLRNLSADPPSSANDAAGAMRRLSTVDSVLASEERPRRTATLTDIREDFEEQAAEQEREALAAKWMIRHNSPFRLLWDRFMGLLILYTSIIIPLDIAFDPFPFSAAIAIDLVITFFFFANIAINFRTTLEKSEGMIDDPKLVAREYARKWLWLDLVSSIPWDTIFIGIIGHSSTVLSVVRLLRVARLLRLFRGSKFSLEYSQVAMQLSKLILYMLGSAHWLGCLWYALSSHEGFHETGIVPGFALFEDRSGVSRYYQCFHWGLWALISMGSELRPTSDLQTTLCMAAIVGGVAMFATIIGNIEVLLSQQSASSSRFQEHLSSLKDFLSHQHISPSLQRHVMQHTLYVYRMQRGVDYQLLLQCLPVELRNKVYRAMYKPALLKVTFFKECEDGFIDALCTLVKPQIALRGDLIIRQGSIGNEMYIVHRGEAEAVDIVSGEVHSRMGEGRFFGEIALFTNSRRSISVRARTYMELYVLHKQDFLKMLEFFPDAEAKMVAVARERLGATDRMLGNFRNQIQQARLNGASSSDLSMAQVREIIQQSGLDDGEEAQQFVTTIMEQFDTNKDGVLDPVEQAHVIKYLKGHADRLRKLTEMRNRSYRFGSHSTAAVLEHQAKLIDVINSKLAQLNDLAHRIERMATGAPNSLATTPAAAPAPAATSAGPGVAAAPPPPLPPAAQQQQGADGSPAVHSRRQTWSPVSGSSAFAAASGTGGGGGGNGPRTPGSQTSHSHFFPHASAGEAGGGGGGGNGGNGGNGTHHAQQLAPPAAGHSGSGSDSGAPSASTSPRLPDLLPRDPRQREELLLRLQPQRFMPISVLGASSAVASPQARTPQETPRNPDKPAASSPRTSHSAHSAPRTPAPADGDEKHEGVSGGSGGTDMTDGGQGGAEAESSHAAAATAAAGGLSEQQQQHQQQQQQQQRQQWAAPRPPRGSLSRANSFPRRRGPQQQQQDSQQPPPQQSPQQQSPQPPPAP